MNFSVEMQYQAYLQRINMPEEKMASENQRIEMRRTFFGAFGQALILMRDGVGSLPETEAIMVMEGMLDETLKFWKNQK